MKNLFKWAALMCVSTGFAQLDTISPLAEVIVISPKKDLNLKQAKPLATLDQYLDSHNFKLVRRGSYAWEPMINNMATERTRITIEGMHVFGACTDKMDPITSYVEVSNLAEANIVSGQAGSAFGPTIGGGMDLRRNRTGFMDLGWKTIASAGFESNSSQAVAGAAVNYSEASFFIDTDLMLRHAGNYKAGNGREILHSGYSKINASATSGWKMGQKSMMEASLILDRASDVGYPALPMDVSLAEAAIASLRFESKPMDSLLQKIEAKIYFNAVTHIMDDTGRENVAIHMDMPGRTRTLGGYASADAKFRNHKIRANLNSFYNMSLAEMTMYPNDPSQNPMFMYTWPDVRTFYNGVFIEDAIEFHCHSVLKLMAGAGLHYNRVASNDGLASLRIFYPQMEPAASRFLKNIAANYSHGEKLHYSFGMGYGERAPSVSEGFGFYLFNSFDNHDYVGNPGLPNEKSLEANASAGYKFDRAAFAVTAAVFSISDYIIGKTDPSLMPMTLGASGVRVYQAVPRATIANIGLNANIIWPAGFKSRHQVNWAYGDESGNRLPFISPLAYQTSLSYERRGLECGLQVWGNAVQDRPAQSFAEDSTPAFAILDVTAGYRFALGAARINFKAGIENVLDAYYSTFSDWNNLPRKGRNLYVNLVVLR